MLDDTSDMETLDVFLDGQKRLVLHRGGRLEVFRSPHPLPQVMTGHCDNYWFSAIIEKKSWGRHHCC